jgi:predicted nucleic acid-binding protein
MRFIDANIFVRYVTADDPGANAIAAAIIQRLSDGKEEAFTTDVHIHETAYVLASRSLYGLSHAVVAGALKQLLLIKNLKMNNKQLCLEALEVFAQYPQLDFADALAVASMRRKGITEIYTFDRDFDRVQGVTRVQS